MNNKIEPLYKSKEKINFGWTAIQGALEYKVYVSLTPSVSGMTLLQDKISTQKSQAPQYQQKVIYNAEIGSIRTLLGLPNTIDFENTVFFYIRTTVTSLGEDTLTEDLVVEIPPVGIGLKTRKDDPTKERLPFAFNEDSQRWIKNISTSGGGLVTCDSDYYKDNIITEFTYDSTGNTLMEKVYKSDSTVAGSFAKLTEYEYTDLVNPTNPTKVTVTDSTV